MASRPLVEDFWAGEVAPYVVDDACPTNPQCDSSEPNPCDDGNADTVDSCAHGYCMNVECRLDADCDDGSPNTEGMCRNNLCQHRACLGDADCSAGQTCNETTYACE